MVQTQSTSFRAATYIYSRCLTLASGILLFNCLRRTRRKNRNLPTLFGQYLEGFPVRIINFTDKADRAQHDRMVSLVEAMLAAKLQLQSARSDKDKDFTRTNATPLTVKLMRSFMNFTN
jgi:hypothetical protein